MNRKNQEKRNSEESDSEEEKQQSGGREGEIGEKNYEARPFVLGKLPEIPLFVTITIYGKRRSGKSFFLRWFFDYYRQFFPWVWVFTLTKHNKFFEAFVPEKFVIPDFNAYSLEEIMKRQKKSRRNLPH